MSLPYIFFLKKNLFTLAVHHNMEENIFSYIHYTLTLKPNPVYAEIE